MIDLSGVDLLTVIGADTSLRRVASTNGGEYAGPCPFCGGVDRFRVWPNHPGGRGRWWCRQCERQGDAIQYVRERDNLGYREALEVLGLEARQEARRGKNMAKLQTKPTPAIHQEAPQPTWDPSAALVVVEKCEAALWADAGVRARAWLAQRGLGERTLRTWRLGYNPTDRKIGGLFVPCGIVIPCFVDGVLWYLKVRRPVPPLPGPKYRQVKGGGKRALFGLDHLKGRRVAVICEGEFDALLVWQEAGDLVDVVALGSATARPSVAFLARLAAATRWLVATDRDDAGEKGAAWWGEYSARVRRVRPLQGNDLTDFHTAGGDLRAWVTYHLERLEAQARPKVSAWDGLEARLEALLAEMEAATGCDDAEAERLLARWDAVEAELLETEMWMA